MAAIVVDASSVLAVLLNEAHRAAVIEMSRGADLISPDSLPFEVTNALSARMKRQDNHRLERGAAKAAFASFMEMDIALLPQTMSDHAHALELAGRHGIYAYDAYLLTASLAHKAALLTLDGLGRKTGLRQLADRLGIALAPLET